MGQPAATDRPCLPSLSHSFTLDFVILINGTKDYAIDTKNKVEGHLEAMGLQLGVNPTLVSLEAIRRKNRQMKELSDDLLHYRNAQKPCRWLSHAHSDPKMKENG